MATWILYRQASRGVGRSKFRSPCGFSGMNSVAHRIYTMIVDLHGRVLALRGLVVVPGVAGQLVQQIPARTVDEQPVLREQAGHGADAVEDVVVAERRRELVAVQLLHEARGGRVHDRPLRADALYVGARDR